jgi:hypothetical protein
MKSITTYLEDEKYKKLKEYAKTKDRSVNKIMNKMIESLLKEKPKLICLQEKKNSKYSEMFDKF